jgi:hypothetical protein
VWSDLPRHWKILLSSIPIVLFVALKNKVIQTLALNYGQGEFLHSGAYALDFWNGF